MARSLRVDAVGQIIPAPTHRVLLSRGGRSPTTRTGRALRGKQGPGFRAPVFMQSVLLDAAGHRRSPATMPGYHRGRPPRNKGERYSADPPTVEEIIAVMRTVGDRSEGHRLRALIVLLWRAGLRLSEALAVQQIDPCLRSRASFQPAWCCASSTGRPPDGAGRHPPACKQLHHAAAEAGVRRRFAPHQLRHAHRGRDGAQRGPADQAIAGSRWVGRRMPADPARYLRLANTRCASQISRTPRLVVAQLGRGGRRWPCQMEV